MLGFESLFGDIISDFSCGVLLECCLAIIIDIAAAALAFSSIMLLLVSSDVSVAKELLGGVIVLVGNSMCFDVVAATAF